MDDDGRTKDINSNQVKSRIKSIVELIGEKELGFTKDEVELHSICSGCAIAKFLSKVSDMIQKIQDLRMDYLNMLESDLNKSVSFKTCRDKAMAQVSEVGLKLIKNANTLM